MASQFASRLSLIAFAAATLRGAIDGVDFQGALRTALVAAGVFFAVGYLCGELARWLVEEQIDMECNRALAGPSEQQTGRDGSASDEKPR